MKIVLEDWEVANIVVEYIEDKYDFQVESFNWGEENSVSLHLKEEEE